MLHGSWKAEAASNRAPQMRRRRLRGDRPMTIDYALSGFLCVGLLVYLLYVLLKPESF
jgi:K+-transporting ATPase KdpF subunit